ncbi:MAG: hypothetical protein ACJ74Q_15145 [Pyrinomonadaceae bacterium]
MKILILHHIEPEYSDFFNEEDYFRHLFNHLSKRAYDRIILTTLSGIVYPELRNVISDEYEWNYYWEDPDDPAYRTWYEEYGYDPADIIPSPTVHQRTYLYEWIKNLKGHDVTLAGGLREECLLDFETALTHLGIPFVRLEECCY